jgi:hypothetical protein
MPVYPGFLGVLATISCFVLSEAYAAGGAWKFDTEDQGHPRLAYLENSKWIFWVGCGHAFGFRAVYPGASKKDEGKVTITVSNTRTQMKFDANIESGFSDKFPPNTTHFYQSDLGFEHQDPEVYGKKWHELESRFFDLLDSGQPLTVSAEGRSYVLPPVKIKGWKLRFKKIC